MRFEALSVSFLALSASATPTLKVGRRDMKHQQHAPTTTNKSPTKRANSTYPDWAKSCATHNAKAWTDLEVDHYLGLYADTWFDPAAPMYSDISFPEAVMKQIPDFTAYSCSLLGQDGCAFDYDNTQIGCTNGEGTSYGSWDALWMFTLYGLSNYQNFMLNLYQTFWSTSNSIIGGDIDQLVNDFTSPPDVHTDVTSEALTIVSGVLGGFSALLGPVSEAVGAAAGAASAGLSTATGILSGAAGAAADYALIKDSRGGVLKKKLTDASTALHQQIQKYADSILQDNVDPSSYGSLGGDHKYMDQSASGPYVLKDGLFAQPVEDGIFTEYEYAMTQAIRGAAISWLWDLEKVFIVKASKGSVEINGKAPCDLDLSSSDMMASQCNNDTDTMYWFLKESSLTYCSDEYKYAPGLKTLTSSWNLTAVDLALAAEASQNANGYQANFTMSTAQDFLTGNNKPHMDLLVNMPVCSLDFFGTDDIPDIRTVEMAYDDRDNHEQFGTPTDEEYVRWAIRTLCPKFYVNDVAFPYKV